MDFFLFLLRFLFGLPLDESDRLQPIRVRKDGRHSCDQPSAATAVRVPGIGWLKLPERFLREPGAVATWTRTGNSTYRSTLDYSSDDWDDGRGRIEK